MGPLFRCIQKRIIASPDELETGDKVCQSQSYMTSMKIHEGKTQLFQEALRKSMAFLEENGPQLMAETYIDLDKMIANAIQVHRDSESILEHWQMSDKYQQDVMQYITTTVVDIFGQPNSAVMEGMKRLAGTGATITVYPHLAGFNRF